MITFKKGYMLSTMLGTQLSAPHMLTIIIIIYVLQWSTCVEHLVGCQALCYTKCLMFISFNPLNSETDTIILILQIKKCRQRDVKQLVSCSAGGQTQAYVIPRPNLFIIMWYWGGTYWMLLGRGQIFAHHLGQSFYFSSTSLTVNYHNVCLFFFSCIILFWSYSLWLFFSV